MESNNDDCVTTFRNNEGGEDIQSVALTLKSMSDNTLFRKLPDYSLINVLVVPDPEPLNSVIILVDCLTHPNPSDFTNDNDDSITSNISDDCSDIILVDENIIQYLMKGSTHDVRSCNTKTFDFRKDFINLIR